MLFCHRMVTTYIHYRVSPMERKKVLRFVDKDLEYLLILSHQECFFCNKSQILFQEKLSKFSVYIVIFKKEKHTHTQKKTPAHL